MAFRVGLRLCRYFVFREIRMQIVTDRGADLSPEQLDDLNIHLAPLRLTLDGKTYASGVDIQPDEFYHLLSETESFPTTSQPSAGEFAALYRQLAQTDPDILSIHISSGLSGTINSARAAAEMVPEANITLVDSKTLSCPLGWQVEAAARAIRLGWSLPDVLERLAHIGEQAEGLFTLNSLKYLIHGGRISHLKGLLASLLNIKPVIGVEREHGRYISHGQEVTLKRAIQKLVDVVTQRYPEGTLLRVQPLHGDNLEAVHLMMAKLEERFEMRREAITSVAPVLGAHTGPSLVGMGVGPMALFADLLA